MCREESDLQNSHVIPEFAYGPIYDDNHKIHAAHPMAPEQSWKIQKGIREYLLCRSCEQFLNNSYEKWFKEYWFDVKPIARLDSEESAILSVPDPARFKLFHMSVLLRAELARHAYWSEVQTGLKHRQRLLDLVRSEDPGGWEEFSVVCYPIRRTPQDPRIWWELVSSPNPGRMDGMRFYQFTFGGCGWLYFVGSHCLPLVRDISLREDGTLPVVKLEWGAFKRYRKALAVQNRPSTYR